MKNLIFRLLFITITSVLLFIYIFPWNSYWINIPFTWKDYKLGLDLQGWIELDYKIDLDELKKEDDYSKQKEKGIIEWLKSIIDKRVETLNINDSIITSANYAGEQHIIVQIPLKWNNSFENNENIERAKKAIWKVVKIEFKELRDEITSEDIEARKELALEILNELKDSKYDFKVTADKYQLNYENIEIWEIDDLKKVFNIEDKDIVVNKIHEIETKAWDLWYLILSIKKVENTEKKEISNYEYLYISKKPSDWKSAKDSEWRILNDKFFVNSSVQYDELFNPMIELVFNNEWAKIFWELTTRLIGKQIAIFVWWEMLTDPRVNTPILTWKAVITWNYTPIEAKELSQNINTWIVPAPIYLTSEKTIDSKLWASSLEKLIIAWVSWFFIIFLFLVFIYRFSGLIASISLFLYIVIVLTIVKSFWIILTLASIAGLILSIGMAIDANILIFERIKDELKSGKNLEWATITWFRKSWTAIWDSNFTWLIVALILFIFGINLIKWFGLMLAIWILVSLFSAMWISRILILLVSKVIKSKERFIWSK